MKQRVIFEANDGSVFYTQEACEEYESNLNLEIGNARDAAKTIKKLCESGCCAECVFGNEDETCKLREDFPYKWDI